MSSGRVDSTPRPAGGTRRCLPAAVGLLVAGCTLSSSSQMRFAPTSVERPAAPFSTELTRTCVVDDCRTQAVQLRMPDGELVTGQLRFVSSAAGAGEGTSVGIGWATPGVASQERKPAVMTLTGDRGSRLTCELLFSAGTRHASGLCRAPSGASYAVSL